MTDPETLPGFVECPRCHQKTEAAKMWLWSDGYGRRLLVRNGSIVQNGHIDVFDLACGCVFDTQLWALTVRSEVSPRLGPSVRSSVTIVPKFMPELDS